MVALALGTQILETVTFGKLSKLRTYPVGRTQALTVGWVLPGAFSKLTPKCRTSKALPQEILGTNASARNS